jgi:serine/threonine-protein kinase
VHRSPWLGLALLLTLVGMAVPAIQHLREVPPPAPPPLLRLTLGAPPGTELGSGDEALDAAISPDETQIVFVATEGGVVSLWRRRLDDELARALPGTEGAQLPAWTPSGDAVSFFADGQLRLLALDGGAPRDLADASAPAGATWLPDGSVLFAPDSRGVLRRLHEGVLSDASTPRAGDRAHVYPLAVEPTGAFVYTAINLNGRRTVRLVRDGEDTDLATTSSHGQLVGDVLLTVRDAVLLGQRIAPGTSRLEGRAVSLASRVAATSSDRGLFTASARILLTAVSAPRARVLAWFDRRGQREETIGDPGDLWQVRLSPDDAFAAVTLMAPLLRTLDVALVPTGGGPAEALTRALAADTDPVWAPDGGRVLFRSFQNGRPELFTTVTHDADASDVAVPSDTTALTPSDWSGPAVLAHAEGTASGEDIWLLNPETGSRTLAIGSGFNDRDGRWSPDRRWIAYVSDESGRPDIYAVRWPNGDRLRVSFAGGTRPRWSRDGRTLFFLRGSRIMGASVPDDRSPRFATAVPVVDVPGIRDFDASRRRDALLALVPVDDDTVSPVSVHIDWASALPIDD